MKENQKGFTLVELIIAVAIVAIVSVTIVSFMITGSKSYASSSTETNIQQEAQIAMNQISDLIIDTSKAVTYTYQADGSDTEHFVEKESEIPSSPYCKRLCMYNGDVAYEVVWKNDGKNRLYYAEYKVTPSGEKEGTPTEYLLSDYVTSFQADLTDLSEKRVVQLDVDFEKGQRKYHASHNVTIRNKIVVNDLNDYEAPPAGGGTVDLVTVQGPVYLAPNESYTFEKPLISGSGSVSQEVTWGFENDADHNSDTTIDQNGTIRIGKTETHLSFRVKAASKADPSKVGFITVNLIRVNNVSLTTNQANFIPEITFSLSASLEDFNIGFDETGTGTSVTWSIEEGASYIDDLGVTSKGRHSYYIKKGVANGTKIRIRATANHSLHWDYPDGNHIYGEFELTVAGMSESKFGIGEEYLIGEEDGYTSPDFPASYVRYVKIESSEPNQNNWVNVGDMYENDGFFQGTYLTEGDFAGWYDIHNYEGTPKIYVPRKLNFDLDYRLTMCEEATEKDVYDREPRKRVLVILEEIVRRTRFIFTSTSPQAPVIMAGHVDIHAYILDRRWDSKTAWNHYNMQISDQPGSITSSGASEVHFTWHGGPDDDFLKVEKNDQYPQFRVDLNRAGEAGTYRFWPTVSYEGRTYDRTESYVEWKVDVGNMKLKGEDAFLPYPSHPEFQNVLAVMEVNRAEEKKTNIYFRNKSHKERVESKEYYFLVSKNSDHTYTIQVFPDKDYDQKNRIGVFRCKESETEWREVQNP